MSPKDKQRAWIAENVFTAPQAAEYLGITRSALHQAVSYGRVEIIKDRFFWKADLDELKPLLKANRK